MRSSGVPPRAASTTARTAARTSSSASDAVSTRVASPGPGAGGDIGRGRLDTDAGERAPDAGVGCLRPGDAGDHRGGADLGDGGDETGLPLEQILGEVDDHVAELAPHPRRLGRTASTAASVRSASSYQPARRTSPSLATEPHHVAGSPAGPRQRLEAPGGDVGQLPEGRHERGLGGRVLGHGREQARVAAQHPAQGGGEHRGRHRATSLGRQTRRPEQLGQPVDGEEGHRRHTRTAVAHRPERTAGQGPPGGHTDVVGRHDHRDRGQRIALLGRGDGTPQRLEGGAPVRGGHDVEGHVARLCTGCDTQGGGLRGAADRALRRAPLRGISCWAAAQQLGSWQR